MITPEKISVNVEGHVTVMDRSTGEVLLSKHNQIHPKNMATAIARGLSNSPNSQIFKIKFGNQGTYIDGSQQIVFRTPNTTGDTADLYNATYVEVVDDSSSLVDSGNSVTFTNIPASTSTRVIVTAVISANQAVNNTTDTGTPGQIGTITDTSNPYFFDELGLFTAATSGTEPLLHGSGELMLSHLIFSPIEHTGNRELTVVYALTISVS